MQRLMQLLDSSEKFLCAVDVSQHRSWKLVWVQRRTRCGFFCHSETPIPQFLPKAQNLLEKGTWEMVRVEYQGGQMWHIFWIWQDYCTYKHTAVLVACVTLALKQASQHLIMERGGACECPIPSWGAIDIDTWWFLEEEQSVFIETLFSHRLTFIQWKASHHWVCGQQVLLPAEPYHWLA